MSCKCHYNHSADGRNPAPVKIPKYPSIYRALYIYISTGAGFLNHQPYGSLLTTMECHNQPTAQVHQATGKVSCHDLTMSHRAVLIGLMLMFIQQPLGNLWISLIWVFPKIGVPPNHPF